MHMLQNLSKFASFILIFALSEAVPAATEVYTQIAKFGAQYFLVDVWKNRVLYSDHFHSDLSQWRILDDKLNHPHSIANYQDIYVVEDTEKDAINVYRATATGFDLIQRIENIASRPHRIIWDYPSRAFWVLASANTYIYKFVLTGDADSPLRVEYAKPLPFLQGKYRRSMTIYKDLMYFTPSEPEGNIIAARYSDDSFTVVDSSAPTPKGFIVGNISYAGNDIFITADGWWYLTALRWGHIIRASSWEAMKRGEWENVGDILGARGNLYYLSEFEGRIWATCHDPCTSPFITFKHGPNGEIKDISRPLLR
ncbi:MAG: hypothetical protein ACR2PV_09010 [Gammaproteobacteria bacterium]